MSCDKDSNIVKQNDKITLLSSSIPIQSQPNLQQNMPEQQDIEDSQMQPQSNQSELNENQQEKQSQLQPQEYEDYEDNGDYDQYNEYMMDQSLGTYDRRISSETNNQCNLEDLTKIIEKENQKVIELTGFDREWALIYFQSCEWKMHLVPIFIDEKLTSHQMIHFKPSNAQMSSLQGTCDVCCLNNQIILKNMCGDQFCESCWKGHLTQKMETFYTDPFPPCMNLECAVKTSPFILQQISKNDIAFKKLYIRTLCRSYATGSSTVKICKGREGFSCDGCFKIKKLMQILECQNCGNFVCARCGQEYHSPSECFDGPNWRKIIQGSTNFIQTLNYRKCPNCGQAVQRSIGCNSVVCKCKKMFCYICGQKWLPNHTQHGACYRQKEIKSLQAQRKKKHQNQKEYIDKVQKFKAQIEKYIQKIKRVDKMDVKQLKLTLTKEFKIVSNQFDYLQPLKKKLRTALLIGKNYVLSMYFSESEVMRAQLANLIPLLQQSYDLLNQTLPNMIEAFSDKEIVGKRATEMRKLNLNPQVELAQHKIQMLEIMKKLDKYLQA